LLRAQVAELKRLNQIWRPEEMHGLKRLKIPVRRHSYMSQLIQEEEVERRRRREREAAADNSGESAPGAASEQSRVDDAENAERLLHAPLPVSEAFLKKLPVIPLGAAAAPPLAGPATPSDSPIDEDHLDRLCSCRHPKLILALFFCGAVGPIIYIVWSHLYGSGEHTS
jgi:hypothetical protein